jgi:GPH family glycoside/pentoside/hexuronide:cation symporter
MLESIAYSLGDAGCNLVWTTISMFLILYYTDSVGLNAAMVGTMMLVARLLDGFSDIGMGLIIDRTHTKMGKARPWILISAPAMAIGLILIFNVPKGFNMHQKTIYAYVTYIFLTAIAYTVSNLSYQTLLSLITDDEKERTRLSSIRFFITMLIIFLIVIFSVKLIDKIGWSKMSFLYSFIALIFLLITSFGTKERVTKDSESTNKREVKKDLKVLFKNKYFLPLSFLFILNYMVSGITAGCGIYYVRDVLRNIDIFPVLSIAGIAPMMIGLLFFPKFANKYGKWKCLMGGFLIKILGLVIKIFVSESIPGCIIVAIIGSIGMVPLSAGLFALVADVIDYGEWTSGRRLDGLTYSVTSFGMKVGTGLGSAMFGWGLALGHYNADLLVQSQKTILSLKIVSIIVPLIIYIIATIVMSRLNLDEFGDQMHKELNERKISKFIK